MMQHPNPRPLYIKLTYVLFSIIAVGYLAILGKEVLSPLLFATLFAILLLPLASFLERKCRLPRGLASIISVLFLLFAIITIFYVVGAQINSLANDWPQFEEQLDTSIKNLQQWISIKAHINLPNQKTFISQQSSKLLASGTTMIGTTLQSLSSFVLFLLFTFIYTFFFLFYRKLIMKFLIAIFLDQNSVLVHNIVESVQTIIRKYIVGLLIEMVTVSTVLCISFSLLGIRYSILLGLLGGLFNVIPYIGIFIVLLISSLITFATAAAASKVLLVIIVLVSTHLVDANILFPWIVGSKVRINAMAMIAGVLIGGMIWGISGMFLSIPVIAVLKIIFDRIESLNSWGILLGTDQHVPLTITETNIKEPEDSAET